MADVVDQSRHRPRASPARGPSFRSAPATCAARRATPAHRASAPAPSVPAHNAPGSGVEGEIWSAMAATWRDGTVPQTTVKKRASRALRSARPSNGCGRRCAPAELLHDLSAARRAEASREQASREVGVPVALSPASRRRHQVAGPTTIRPARRARPPPARSAPRPRQNIRTGMASATATVSASGRRARSAPTAKSWSTRCRTSRRATADGLAPIVERQQTVVGDIAQDNRALAPETGRCAAATPGSEAVAGLGSASAIAATAHIMALANQVMLAARRPASTDQRAPERRVPRVRARHARDLGPRRRCRGDAQAHRRDHRRDDRPSVAPTRWSTGSLPALEAAGIEHGGPLAPAWRVVTVVPVSVSKASSSTRGRVRAGQHRPRRAAGLRALYVA